MQVVVVLAHQAVVVDILVLVVLVINKLGQAPIFHHLYNLKEMMVVMVLILELQIMVVAVAAALAVLVQMEHPP